MLDKFLEVSYQHQQAIDLRNEMAQAMMSLPNEMLHKLASGQEKLAFHGMGESPGGGCWLDQFKGSPLYDQAIQLEEESIKLQAQSKAQSREDRDQRDQFYDAEDAVRLKKKMLELDLRKAETSGEEEAPAHEAVEAPQEEASEEAAEAMKEGSALRTLLVASMRKEAAEGGMSPSDILAAREAAGGTGGMAAGGVLGGIAGSRGGIALGRRAPILGRVATPIIGGIGGAGLGILGGMGVGGAVGRSVGRTMGSPAALMADPEVQAALAEVEAKKAKPKGKEKKSSVHPDIIASMRMDKLAEGLPPALKATKIPKGTDLDKDGKKGEGKSKLAFMKQSSSRVVADAWGREMAQMQKEALLAGVGAASKALWGGAKQVAGAGKAGFKGMGAAGSPLMRAGAQGPQAVKGVRGALTGAGQALKTMDPRVAMGLGAAGAGVAGLGAGAALS